MRSGSMTIAAFAEALQGSRGGLTDYPPVPPSPPHAIGPKNAPMHVTAL